MSGGGLLSLPSIFAHSGKGLKFGGTIEREKIATGSGQRSFVGR